MRAGLGATVFPQPALFGSVGFELQAALFDSRDFFSTLDAHVSRLKDSDYIRMTLGQAFDEYFRLSRIRADLGAVPHIAQSSVDPFGLAIAQLARLSGVNEASLLAAARGHVPTWLREVRRWSDTSTPLSPSNEAERIALASSVFLASWELLQYVHGDAARDIAATAIGILGPVDDLLGFDLKPV